MSPLNHSFVSPKNEGSDAARASANEWNLPHVVSGVVDFTAATSFIMPATRFKSGSPWIDVKAYGAVGDGSTDDTTAIQNAIYAAKTSYASGVVFFPPGNYVVSQLTLYIGVSLKGSGLAAPISNAAGGTQLLQKPGTDLDLIVFSSVDAFMSNVEIAHMRLIGDAAATTSSGINFAAVAPNYGTSIHHLIVGSFAKNGISLFGGFDSCHLHDLGLHNNGVGAGGGYGIEMITTGTVPGTLCPVGFIYGDNNKSGLIHIKSGSGMGGAMSFHISDCKGEKNIAGRQNDLIVLENMNGTPVLIESCSALNTSGEEGNSVVKNIGATVSLEWRGLNAYTDAAHTAGNGFLWLVNDVFGGVNFPPDGASSSGTNRPFGSFSFTSLTIGTSLKLAHLLAQNTAPTISSGFGTSPSISGSNGTACFRITVGTGGVASSGVIALPAATQGWMCIVNNINAASGNRADNTRQTAATSTSVTLQNQTTSTGAATPWVAGDTLFVICFAY